MKRVDRGSGATLAAAPAPASARRHRGGIKNFKLTLFNAPRGYAKLHAALTRQHVIYAPFDGIASAATSRLADVLGARTLQLHEMVPLPGEGDGLGDPIDLVPWTANHRSTTDILEDDADGAVTSSASRREAEAAVCDSVMRRLEGLLTVVHEWNHSVFVKQPLKETVALGQRGGKDVLNQVADFEARLRSVELARLLEARGVIRQEPSDACPGPDAAAEEPAVDVDAPEVDWGAEDDACQRALEEALRRQTELDASWQDDEGPPPAQEERILDFTTGAGLIES